MSLFHQQNSYPFCFSSSSDLPFAYLAGQTVDIARFKRDVCALQADLERSKPGNTLITASGRYAFSVALLASWLAGRSAILPPDNHRATLENIYLRDSVSFECDLAWEADLIENNQTETGHGSWSVQLQGEANAVIIYTSGSTGEPVGIVKTIENLFAEVNCLNECFEWPAGPIVGTVPSQHLYGLTFTVLLPWCRGIPLVDSIPVFPLDVSRVLRETQAKALVSVPAHYKALLHNDFKATSLFSISAAAFLHQDVSLAWAQQNGLPITEIYGSTETGVVASRVSPDSELWQILPKVKLRFKSELLFVSSPFVSTQWPQGFQSSDLGALENENQFRLLGRADSVVKICGKRVSLKEIERVLFECDGVDDVAVLAMDVDGQIRDRVIWAALVLTEPIPISVLRQQLRSRLDSISIPKRFIITDSLPRNKSGKVLRQALESLFEERLVS